MSDSLHGSAGNPLVFLSYSLEDRAVVNSVYGRLQAVGLRPWMDIHDIPSGSTWEAGIRGAIGRASFVLVFLSTRSLNHRGYAQKEIRLALDMFQELSIKTFLIPVRLEECVVPAPLSKFQSVDLFEQAGWDQLIRALGRPQTNPAALEVIKQVTAAEERRERFRKHVFVAMPFSQDMEDVFYYGIQRAVDANDMLCERADRDTFTGDVLLRIKERIDVAAAVVADLTNANPNVYLEVGYAWGRGIATILLVQNTEHLKFDVRGQRCLQYTSIRMLEEKLTAELAGLKLEGSL